jgi:hypothetical protein
MDKLIFVSIIGTDGEQVEHVMIDRGNDEFTSMLKSTYEEQQAALKTPMVIDGD